MPNEFETIERGELTIVRPLANRLDADLAPDFQQHLIDLHEGGHHRLILDLSAVDFVDSSGLGSIVTVFKRTAQRGGDLRLCRIRRSVMSSLERTRLDRRLKLHASVEEAEADLAP